MSRRLLNTGLAAFIGVSALGLCATSASAMPLPPERPLIDQAAQASHPAIEARYVVRHGHRVWVNDGLVNHPEGSMGQGPTPLDQGNQTGRLTPAQQAYIADRDGPRYAKRHPGYAHYYQGFYYSRPWWLGGNAVGKASMQPAGTTDHSALCRDRYPHYNARTDMFRAADGKMYRCMTTNH